MLIARRLFDSFLEAMTEEEKDKAYELAVDSIEESMSMLANLYEKNFGDYPTGLVASFIYQHLKDKVFQMTHQVAS